LGLKGLVVVVDDDCVLLLFCRMENQPSWMPRIGMEFDSVDEAWDFWVAYSGIVGFLAVVPWRSMGFWA
jgi:hypothetical protein